MILCYTHRTILFLVITKEASPQSRCGKMNIHTVIYYAEYKLEVSIKSLPLRAQGILQKRKLKDYKSQRDGGHQNTAL